MGFFKKIGGAFKVGGKFAWKTYNRPEGKVLVSMFVPAAPLVGLTLAISSAKHIIQEIGDNNKVKYARQIILTEFPEVRGNIKLLNFMIEAKLQELAGNLDID